MNVEVWQQAHIEKQTHRSLCEEKTSNIYRLAHEDNIGVKFIYQGKGGKTLGSRAVDICEIS
ncbi:hypothetical protein [Moritella sp. Urea-trap-13]|uniref:hypothetical protein n=1 Tax=Moritella sp. Urea-trap-13 TaxID=2058327 RepID=UPI001E44240B|nr:hypothetical protein [Moritella sp. Urea-trap-13]